MLLHLPRERKVEEGVGPALAATLGGKAGLRRQDRVGRNGENLFASVSIPHPTGLDQTGADQALQHAAPIRRCCAFEMVGQPIDVAGNRLRIVETACTCLPIAQDFEVECWEEEIHIDTVQLHSEDLLEDGAGQLFRQLDLHRRASPSVRSIKRGCCCSRRWR